MSEADSIARAELPATVESLAHDLRALGVREGSTLLVHSSLSSLGWVCGGPEAVVLALQRAVGDNGTLVMPAQTGGNSEPEYWQHPPVPADWWPVIRQHAPPFDPRSTPTRGMGAIAECFRNMPGVARSSHPQVSFTAWGRYTRAILSDHRLANGLGEESPLARVYDLEGSVLLLGVEYNRNTSLHLSEYRADWPGRKTRKQAAAMMVDGMRMWVRFDELDKDTEDFNQIGWDFVQAGQVKTGKAACAKAQLMSQRALVDFGAQWISKHRK